MPDSITQTGTVWTNCCWQSLGAIALIIVLTGVLLWFQAAPHDLSQILASLVAVILGLFGAVVLAKMFCGPIDLRLLVSETDGGASMSRFQFLIFTFVIAASYLVITFKGGTLVEVPGSVLGLIGISSGSYVASKVVQKASETAQATAASQAAAQPQVTITTTTP